MKTGKPERSRRLASRVHGPARAAGPPLSDAQTSEGGENSAPPVLSGTPGQEAARTRVGAPRALPRAGEPGTQREP